MLGNILLISSAAMHAFWNALIKREGEPRVNTILVLLVSLIFTTILLPFSSTPYFANQNSITWAVAAGFFEGGYLTSLALSLEAAPLGTTYVISRGGAMLFVWLFSSTLLGESVTSQTVLGSILVFLGLFFTHWKPKSASKLKHKYAWAYLCAFFIAGYHLFYGQALSSGAQPFPLFILSLGIGFPIYLFSCDKVLIKKVKNIPRNYFFILVLGGVLCALSFLLFLRGLSYTGAGVAITLRNTSVIFAMIFSFWIGERHSRLQWLGALLVAVGAGFISLG